MGFLNTVTSAIGIADALTGGMKVVDLDVKHCKDIYELYDKVKDLDFPLGKPRIEKVAGLGDAIAYPALDKNNQVQIWYQKKKFFICRNPNIAGGKKFLASMGLDSLTEGLTGLSANFGDKKALCNQLVEEMAAKLNTMDL